MWKDSRGGADDIYRANTLHSFTLTHPVRRQEKEHNAEEGLACCTTVPL